MPAKQTQMNDRQKRIAELCDGVRSSKQIAAILGERVKYVQATMLKWDLPRLKQAPPSGERNPAWNGGRTIDCDGYVLVSAPLGHPHARYLPRKNVGRILEHRLMMEEKLGRYLDPIEVVDHIDGLRLHNSIDNLRLFESNSRHLKTTITGQIPNWSAKGLEKLHTSMIERKGSQPVHIYNRMKKSGDARLIQILLAAFELGIDSPYLLGTRRHLEKAGLFPLEHSMIEPALARLYQKYA